MSCIHNDHSHTVLWFLVIFLLARACETGPGVHERLERLEQKVNAQ